MLHLEELDSVLRAGWQLEGDSIWSQEMEKQKALLKGTRFTDKSNFFCLLQDTVGFQSPVKSSASPRSSEKQKEPHTEKQ